MSPGDDFQPRGPAERWLDAVFDGLTGTGSGGRRALAEMEDHLRDSVGDGIGRGLDRAEAERDAVARFGSPERVARGIRSAHRNLLRPLLTGTWSLAAAAALTVGISTTLTAVLTIVIDGHLDRGVCVMVSGTSPPHPCGAGNAYYLGAEGLALVGVGLFILGALALLYPCTAEHAIAWLPRARSLLTIAVLFALASLYLLGTPYTTFVPQYRAESILLPIACAVVATSAGVLVPVSMARLQRRLVGRQIAQPS
ncbi:permease prefix domain 1-containing protein [Rugosimonospora africana]|uniref:Uncharacterized protein n=1 Tax=Rugosimonospora africana TaxID=556532 RepID=A0A8J3QUX9_9ACTN|nr:permease prefix domain 1-containing protein [Rugosimonospora africana]GIH15291.1 hypothetical protein Raf01_34630 [Rugosimonospora africana]